MPVAGYRATAIRRRRRNGHLAVAMRFNPGRMLVGGALALTGTLLLLDLAGLVDAGRLISDWWPVLLVVAGIIQLTLNPGHWFPPLFLIGLGAALLAGTTGLVAGDIAWPLFGAALLVLLGIAVVAGWTRGRPEPSPSADERMTVMAIMSRQQAANRSKRFSGGSLTAIFGSAEIDLTGATMVPGSVVDVLTIGGASDIVVPPGWKVEMRGLPLFGSWNNVTESVTDGPELVVNATVVLGSLDVRYPTP
jgi:hypothetical protein